MCNRKLRNCNKTFTMTTNMPKTTTTFIWAIVLLAATTARAQQFKELNAKLQKIVTTHSAVTGIAIRHIESKKLVTINNVYNYPMQSTFKFPLAMYILDNVDKGKMKLTQKVHITKADLKPKTWSPLREKHPEGNIDLTLAELLEYTVSKSDNNTCDILFKLAGGPKVVDKYIHSLGVKDMAIAATEAQMATSWKVQYTNWTFPESMTILLDGLYNKRFLSEGSSNFLIKLMTESANSEKRIKGMLPKGTKVAHKTGTSDTNKEGITAATNDVGIITLPNGKHLAIAVYVCDSKEKPEMGEQIIAEIAKAAYDEFSK